MPETDDYFDDPESDPTQENEEDLEPTELPEVAEAVVTATDWTTETILRQLLRGNIDLNPRFQRRDAWTAPRKSLFIESIILGLPVPQLVLAERADQKGAFLVIDGKQRLLTLLQFAAQDGSPFRSLSLRGLEIRDDLNGTTYADLQAEGRERDLTAFDNQAIRTVVVRNWKDENLLFRIFLRLNTNSVPLSPQELRQALHPGPFVDFLDDYSSDSSALHRVLGIDGPDFRMRDVELLLRYFAFKHFLADYRGNLKAFLDEVCDKLNERWESDSADLEQDAHACELAIETTYAIFDDGAFRRWNGDHYERRFNRAVYDAMVFYLDDEEVAERAMDRDDQVRQAFEGLSQQDEEFDLSLHAVQVIPGGESGNPAGPWFGNQLGLWLTNEYHEATTRRGDIDVLLRQRFVPVS
jgi:Protein of unknown function DUF262